MKIAWSVLCLVVACAHEDEHTCIGDRQSLDCARRGVEEDSIATSLLQHSVGFAGTRAFSSHQLPMQDDQSSMRSSRHKIWPHPTSTTRLPSADEIQQAKGKFHVIATANADIYEAWQVRTLYHSYLQLYQSADSGALGGFTRILHTGEPDALMDEVPTAVVGKLVTDYPCLKAPHGIRQWLLMYRVPEEYILYIEPDFLFLRPMPLLASEKLAAAAPYWYMQVKGLHNGGSKDYKLFNLLQKYNDAKVAINDKDLMPSGHAPVMIHKDEFAKVVPVWLDVALRMNKDNEAKKTFGWILTMWAYDVASWQSGVKHRLLPELQVMPASLGDANGGNSAQLTASNGKPTYLIHYCYPLTRNFTMYEANGSKNGTWHFYKKDFHDKLPPREGIAMPPKGTDEVAVKFIEMINDGIKSLEGVRTAFGKGLLAGWTEESRFAR